MGIHLTVSNLTKVVVQLNLPFLELLACLKISKKIISTLKDMW